MRYHALACDYDGTLAADGRVDEATVAALERVRASGRRLILVTGRELDDLQRVFPRLDLFERVVAENGALLYRPASREEQPLAEPPPEELIEALRGRGVEPLAVGRVILATWTPHEVDVLDAIRDHGLEYQVIFNKGAVMVLPPGVNKASGLAAALDELGLSPHNVVGVGDAENDHAFLSMCECAVAVANALPAVKEQSDLVTQGDHGAGVQELIDLLVSDDLSAAAPRLWRHDILLGTREGGDEVHLKPYGGSILIAGASGSGKSTATTGILERLADQGYQFCLADPEGDYEGLREAIYLGGIDARPELSEILQVLDDPAQNVAVSLLGIPLEDRPAFFEGLLPRLQELRAQRGRPHWIVVDEAHHLLPTAWDPAALTLPQKLDRLIMVTIHPERVSPAALSTVSVVIAIGESADRILAGFCAALGTAPPPLEPIDLEPGEALVWLCGRPEPPFRVQTIEGRTERRRHRRKYAVGELIPEEQFHFRGPEGKLDLRAQNLMIFMQVGEGVDDETWLYHLRRGDYSTWFREVIKDDELAEEARQVETDDGLSADESRARIKDAIEQRYTLPE